MRKYFNRRCLGLHALLMVFVPLFLLAGWWQYEVALRGNDLSWVYTIEWPAFAVYAVYMWWKLIHDRTTGLERLWVARRRAVAEEDGTPLYQIPGWALDKSLAREVREASLGRKPQAVLPPSRRAALGTPGSQPASTLPVVSHRQAGMPGPSPIPAGQGVDGAGPQPGAVIDVPAVSVTMHPDEELDAYNRYLFELSLADPPKRWAARRGVVRQDASGRDPG